MRRSKATLIRDLDNPDVEEIPSAAKTQVMPDDSVSGNRYFNYWCQSAAHRPRRWSCRQLDDSPRLIDAAAAVVRTATRGLVARRRSQRSSSAGSSENFRRTSFSDRLDGTDARPRSSRRGEACSSTGDPLERSTLQCGV